MFVEFYKDNIGSAESVELAKTKLIKNTLSEKLVGEQKLVDFDSSDMESKIKGSVLPSLFYTFMYKAEEDVISGIRFSDAIPVVLCFKRSTKWLEGLNFNLLPNEVRAAILDIIDKSTDNYYSEKGKNLAINGNIAVNETLVGVLADDNQRMALLNLLEKRMGVSIKSAYRRYNLSHIENLRLIEYGDYKYIPLLCFESSVRGAGIAEIQKKVIGGDK